MTPNKIFEYRKGDVFDIYHTNELINLDHRTADLVSENVEEEDLEDEIKEAKRDYYYVSDYLRELEDEIDFDPHYVESFLQEYKTQWGAKGSVTRYRFVCTFKRGNDQFSTPWAQGNPDPPEFADVLEMVLDDTFSIDQYSKVRDNSTAFEDWATELAYGADIEDGDFRSIAQTYKKAKHDWETTWQVHDGCFTLFTDEEMENFKHAFEEGRRR